jgi:1-acyl-sn-glycerol-3-phosphate acyltransferase
VEGLSVDAWKLAPAADLHLTGLERCRSLNRESGLVESAARFVVWSGLRLGLGILHRLEITGRERLPAAPPFILAANHASHLDALVFGCAVGPQWRDHLYPVAAGDLFFQRRSVASLVTGLLNAVPMWRRKPGAHGVVGLRNLLLERRGILIVFPEGTRTRDGRMASFKSGIGMLAAGTQAPVVPCHLHGTFEAFPPNRVLPRPARIRLRIGEPLYFADAANDREGWDRVAGAVEAAVLRLGGL